MLMTLLMMVGLAFGDCSLDLTVPASATMTTIRIGRERILVRGLAARMSASTRLRDCGLDEAANYLDEWRRQRRLTNGTAIIGVTVLGVTIFATPFHALSAGRKKALMVQAIEQID
jgi:hypothetical protein